MGSEPGVLQAMTISEDFQKRQAEKPDQFTLAWWNQQYTELHKDVRGATHGIHLALADNEDLGKAVKELHGRVQALEAAGELDRAKIGELQARVEKMADWAAKLKNGKNP
jgi:hypothetical protein